MTDIEKWLRKKEKQPRRCRTNEFFYQTVNLQSAINQFFLRMTLCFRNICNLIKLKISSSCLWTLHIPFGGTYGEWSLKSFSVRLHVFIHLCLITCVVSNFDCLTQQMLLNLCRWPSGHFTPLHTVHWVQNIISHTEKVTLRYTQSKLHCINNGRCTINIRRMNLAILHGGRRFLKK